MDTESTSSFSSSQPHMTDSSEARILADALTDNPVVINDPGGPRFPEGSLDFDAPLVPHDTDGGSSQLMGSSSSSKGPKTKKRRRHDGSKEEEEEKDDGSDDKDKNPRHDDVGSKKEPRTNGDDTDDEDTKPAANK
jgi:hypothetical protein